MDGRGKSPWMVSDGFKKTTAHIVVLFEMNEKGGKTDRRKEKGQNKTGKTPSDWHLGARVKTWENSWQVSGEGVTWSSKLNKNGNSVIQKTH